MSSLSLSQQIPIPEFFQFWDWVVLAVVMMTTMAAVIWGGFTQKQRGVLDLLLMGRKLSLPLFVVSLSASWQGDPMGLSAAVYQRGAAAFLDQVVWYLVFLFFAFFMLKKLRATKAVTVPDLVRLYYGKRAARLAAIFNIFNLLPVAYALALGILFQNIFGGELYENLLVALLGAGVYAAFGGFRADVYADAVQGVVMLGAMLAAGIFLWVQFGGGTFLSENLSAEFLNAFHEFSFNGFALNLLLASSILVNPILYQRALAAGSDSLARRGIFISIAFWIVFDLMLFMGGSYARALMPDVNPDPAFFVLALTSLPEGLRGLFVAGIFATIVSTIDSCLLISGTSLSYDLFGLRKVSVKTHQAFILAACLITFLSALSYKQGFGNMWELLGSLWGGCLLIPILLPLLFRRRYPGYAFVLSTLISGFVMILWAQWDRTGWLQHVHHIYIGILGSVFTYLWARIYEGLRAARSKKAAYSRAGRSAS